MRPPLTNLLDVFLTAEPVIASTHVQVSWEEATDPAYERCVLVYDRTMEDNEYMYNLKMLQFRVSWREGKALPIEQFSMDRVQKDVETRISFALEPAGAAYEKSFVAQVQALRGSAPHAFDALLQHLEEKATDNPGMPDLAGLRLMREVKQSPRVMTFDFAKGDISVICGEKDVTEGMLKLCQDLGVIVKKV